MELVTQFYGGGTRMTEEDIKITGTVVRITFQNEETGYTILKAKVERERLPVAVVGLFPDVHVGQEYEWTGTWMTHPQYGKQFQAQSARLLLPTTIEGIERFLASGWIRGVGPSTAKKLVTTFGTDVFKVMEETPEQLETIPGIGPAKARKITESYRENQHVQRLMVFLQSHGVGQAIGLKVYRMYGERAIEVLQQNPYRLAIDVHGIGFRTADRIAKSLGIAHDSPERLQAGIFYCLQSSLEEGHVCLPLDELQKKVRIELNVSDLTEESLLTYCNQIRDLVVEREESGRFYVYLRPYFVMEDFIANWLTRKLKASTASSLNEQSSGRTIDWDLDGHLQHLAPEQLEAVRLSVTSPVLILTGGPGTGKTTTVRAILEMAKRTGQHVILAAPTGRAAKRLTEATGEPAKTVHRLLEAIHVEGAGLQFARHATNPLQGDVCIVDEVSMLDVQMAYYLLRALPEHARLILVGDTNQLPSVGAGQVLKDLMDSGVVPKVELTTVFRQAEQSLIVRNAHRVLRGQMLEPGHKTDDCFFIPEDNPERLEQLLKDLVTTRLPRFLFGHGIGEVVEEWDLQSSDVQDAIQVLTPMRKGRFGVERINELLQETLNPFVHGKAELRSQGVVFRVGDKVMQTKNNYNKDVYNGDIGRICVIDPEERLVTVEFPDKGKVTYEGQELDEIALAYAMTIHKSQGSEYPVVILPMVMEHAILLQRQMFYTALTRARRMVVIIGQEKALQKTIANTSQARRFTRLRERLEMRMTCR
jgi:exodeoxyribonuclease V alpha subunit